MSYAYPQPVWHRPVPMRTTAPVSLHVVAVFQYLGGLLTIGVGVMLALAAASLIPELEVTTGDSTWRNRPADVTPAVAIIVGVFALVGLTAIVLGRKVQRGRNWARVLLTILNLLSIAAVGWQAYAESLVTAGTLASLVLPVAFVMLLNTRAARSWCRHGTY